MRSSGSRGTWNDRGGEPHRVGAGRRSRRRNPVAAAAEECTVVALENAAVYAGPRGARGVVAPCGGDVAVRSSQHQRCWIRTDSGFAGAGCCSVSGGACRTADGWSRATSGYDAPTSAGAACSRGWRHRRSSSAGREPGLAIGDGDVGAASCRTRRGRVHRGAIGRQVIGCSRSAASSDDGLDVRTGCGRRTGVRGATRGGGRGSGGECTVPVCYDRRHSGNAAEWCWGLLSGPPRRRRV